MDEAQLRTIEALTDAASVVMEAARTNMISFSDASHHIELYLKEIDGALYPKPAEPEAK